MLTSQLLLLIETVEMALWTCVIGATFRHAIPLEAETHPPKFEIASMYPRTVGVHIGGVVVVRRIVQCSIYGNVGARVGRWEKTPSLTPRKLFARPRPKVQSGRHRPGLAYVTRQMPTQVPPAAARRNSPYTSSLSFLLLPSFSYLARRYTRRPCFVSKEPMRPYHSQSGPDNVCYLGQTWKCGSNPRQH